MPGREQCSDCRQVTGRAWTCDALAADRSLLRQRKTIRRRQRRISGKSRDRASTDDVPALRERAVRMRGVMEKCTFCVQRIEEAKIAAHVRAGTSNNNLRIPRDSFTSACAQACPHEAITFGDIKDPESKVSKMKQQDRNYRLLEYLNVNTRTSYLGRIRNPNPKMPDAENIGVASPEKA